MIFLVISILVVQIQLIKNHIKSKYVRSHNSTIFWPGPRDGSNAALQCFPSSAPSLHTRSIFCILSGWISYYSTHWQDMRTGDNNATMCALKNQHFISLTPFFCDLAGSHLPPPLKRSNIKADCNQQYEVNIDRHEVVFKNITLLTRRAQ